MSTLRSQWQKNQSTIWLVCGVVCVFLAFIFWILIEKESVKMVEKETENEIQIQPEKVAATTHLGGLTEEVKPLETTSRIKVSGNHEAQFRGTKFMNDHEDNYTIELFRSSKEDVIKNFLRQQASRDGFIYIRLSGEGVPEQYVLLFGNFNNELSAQSELPKLSIRLPDSVKPSVKAFEDYAAHVNDLGSEEVGLSNKLYAVKLSPAPMPRVDIVTPTVTPASPENAVTTTTVTRKDVDGNVVDVQKSHSEQAIPNPTAP